MHKTIWMLLMLLLPLASVAQTAEERAEQMKANADYICGEGWGETYNSADQAALADLISKISLNISNSFEIKEEEFNTNSNFDSKTAVTSVMNSYAQATLTNTNNLVISNTPQTHVLRYIKRSEVNKIFDERKEKVFDYVRSAMRAEEKAKIDDALRNYYWAFAMVRSLQYPNSVKMTIDGVQRLLVTWIPQQIEEILGNISTKVASKDGNDINLFIKYKGEPVASLDYTYFDGQTWSNLYSAKDGMGIVELRPGVDINSLQLKYEYEYADQCQIDKELESVMHLFKGTPFKNATTYINNLDKKTAVSSEAKKDFEKSESAANLADLGKVEDEKTLADIMGKVVNAIKTQNYDSANEYFSEDGLEMYKKLLNYGKARLLGDPQFSFYKMGKRVVCRSIPMAFSFQNNKRKFVEDVTFTFDENKKIECVAFGLGSQAKTDIFNKGVGAWSDYAKMVSHRHFPGELQDGIRPETTRLSGERVRRQRHHHHGSHHQESAQGGHRGRKLHRQQQQAHQIHTPNQERVYEKAEDVLPKQSIHQHPIRRQRRGKDGSRRRDLRHPNQARLLLHQLRRPRLPLPNGGFQRPREPIHQGENLAARPQPKHQLEPSSFEQRLGYHRSRKLLNKNKSL